VNDVAGEWKRCFRMQSEPICRHLSESTAHPVVPESVRPCQGIAFVRVQFLAIDDDAEGTIAALVDLDGLDLHPWPATEQPGPLPSQARIAVANLPHLGRKFAFCTDGVRFAPIEHKRYEAWPESKEHQITYPSEG